MTADAAHVAAVAEALREHDVFERRSDLTAVCMCGFDFDPCHFGDPWNDHLATVAVEVLTPLIAAERDALAAENARLGARVQAVEALCNDPRARYIDGMRWVGAVNVRNALATTEAGAES